MMEAKIVKEKIVYLKSLLKKLEIRNDKYKKEQNEEEKETLFAAMSKFAEEIVETGIKINNKLLESKEDFASSYYETFTKLLLHYPFEKELFEKLAQTTGLRNRIAHEYDSIDPTITLRSFENILKLYPKYISSILKEI